MSQNPSMDFADAFSSFVNCNSNSRLVTAAKLASQDHRTLQQKMMVFCIAFIENMAINRTDARNEASVDLAKKIMETTTERDRILPYI